MHIKASTLAAASAAPLLMLGALAQAQPTAPTVPDVTQPLRGDQARAGPTLTCRLDSGPRAGSSFDFTGTAEFPAQAGSTCSDMAGSSGVALAPEIAGQPGQNPTRRQGLGRYYQQGPVTRESTWTCRFTRGPRAGTSYDFSMIAGSVAAPVGSGCSDRAGSTGVAVPPNRSQQWQQNQGPY